MKNCANKTKYHCRFVQIVMFRGRNLIKTNSTTLKPNVVKLIYYYVASLYLCVDLCVAMEVISESEVLRTKQNAILQETSGE